MTGGPASLVRSLHGGGVVERDPATQETVVRFRGLACRLGRLRPSIDAALRSLERSAASADELEALAAGGDATALAVWYHALHLLEQIGVLGYAVRGDTGALIAQFTTMVAGTPVRPSTARDRLALSRFAFLRRDGDRLLIESSRSPVIGELHDPLVAALVARLSTPCRRAALADGAGALGAGAVDALLALLDGADFVTGVTESGEREEDLVPHVAEWEFADALFHARSRGGTHDRPFGATYPFRDRRPPSPALKPAMSTCVSPLDRADIDTLRAADVPFTDVLESRRSVRAYADRPITRRELGEFLYRAARVRAVRESASDRPYAVTDRVSPGGGACHELEIYAVVGTCDGLAPGLYHYDPVAHALELIDAPAALVGQLLADARTPDLAAPRQVLLVLSARFARLTWKYQSIAYATVLKDVGALLQTFYLVATAMRLAPCAIGGGNAALFASLIGTDYHDETSVGEFLLGALPVNA